MTNKKRFLRLETLVAYLQSESDGDEIYLKFKEEKVAPADEKFLKVQTEPVKLNTEIELEGGDKWVEVELWDYDRFSPDDCLGKFRLLVDEIAETFSAELVRADDSQARYVLNWSVIERLDR